MISTRCERTFAGGIHPPQNKQLSSEIPIQPGPAVRQVAVMLSQHIGVVCEPVVSKGQPVQAGQKIADSDAYVSAPVHSPIDGKVKEIALRSHPVLGRSAAVVIEADEPYRPTVPAWPEHIDLDSYSPQQIYQAIHQAGIVGMGGAGFPTHVKVAPDPRMPKDTLLVNGCECEPYITCDYRIMLEWTERIVTGIELAQRASGCRRVVIGIEDNKPAAIEALRSAIADRPGRDNITLVPVKTKYPQGGERQLIRAVLGKIVPTGGIPPMIGVVVLNVATVVAIAEAVLRQQPLTHRVVTVTGQGIARPGNYYVAIGTSIRELLECSGGLTDNAVSVIMGGPMMGVAIADLDTPVMKTTGAVTVLTDEQIGRAKQQANQTACIRCGRCLEVCPERLSPTRIAHAVKYNLLDLAERYYITACIECGCCSYVCPARIELTGYIKTGKIALARQRKRMPE